MLSLRWVVAIVTVAVCAGAGPERASAQDGQSVPIFAPQARVRQQLSHYVRPDYPAFARVANIGAIVGIEITISENGLVEHTSVVRSAPMLDGAAQEAVSRWRFTPFTVNGRAVRVQTVVFERFADGIVMPYEDPVAESQISTLASCRSAAESKDYEAASLLCSQAIEGFALSRQYAVFGARAHAFAGSVHLGKGQAAEAQRLLSRAWTLIDRPSSPHDDKARIARELARAHRATGDLDQANRSYGRSQNAWIAGRNAASAGSRRRQHLTEELKATLLEMADTLRQAGKTKDAEKAEKRAAEVKP